MLSRAVCIASQCLETECVEDATDSDSVHVLDEPEKRGDMWNRGPPRALQSAGRCISPGLISCRRRYGLQTTKQGRHITLSSDTACAAHVHFNVSVRYADISLRELDST